MSKKKKKQTPPRAQIDREKRQAAKKAAHNAMDMATLVCCLALRDEFGFGEKRIVRFLERIDSLCDNLEEHYVRLADIQGTLKDELGMTFEGFVMNQKY